MLKSLIFLFPSQIIAVNKGDTMGLLMMRRTEDEEALYSVIFSVTLFKDSDSETHFTFLFM